MNYYKLIQKYPSLPSDWEVGMAVGQGDRGVQGGFSPCNAKYSDNKRIPLNEVVSNPDYWELVEVQNFEILSISFGDDIYVKTGETIRDFPSTNIVNVFRSEGKVGLVTDARIQNEGKYNTAINSVKRLSDGTVFTVGDIVVRHKDENCLIPNSTHRTISSIYLGTSNDIRFNAENGDNAFMLELFSHVKKPLFTTFDGVDIFEGDTWWYVKLSNLKVNQTSTTRYAGPTSQKSDVVRFSTEEAANSYAERIKVFTTTDGVDIYKGDSFWCPQTKGITNEYSGTVLEIVCRGSVHSKTRTGETKTFSTRQAAENFLNPIFTTEDGVDISVGDSYWFYWIQKPARGQEIFKPYFVKRATELEANTTMSPRSEARFFKSKKKAKEYAENHELLSNKKISGFDLIDYLKGQDIELDGLNPVFLKFLKKL